MPPAHPFRAATQPLDGVPDPAHDESMETWTFVVGVVAIIGTLGSLIGLLMRQNSQAHALIGQRIDDTRNDLSKRIDDAHRATNKRIDDARHDLGTRIGATDKRIDDLRADNRDLAKRIDDAHQATDKRIDDLRADNREVHNDLRAILRTLVRPPTGQ